MGDIFILDSGGHYHFGMASEKYLEEFKITKLKYTVDCIASGDQFIADALKTAAILADQPNTAAVEMEGAAVAQVCSDFGIPFYSDSNHI